MGERIVQLRSSRRHGENLRLATIIPRKRLNGMLNCIVLVRRRMILSTVTMQCVVLQGNGCVLCSSIRKGGNLSLATIHCAIQGG